MPGFSTRRNGPKKSRGRFQQSANAVGGGGHLDRGSSAAQYWGGGGGNDEPVLLQIADVPNCEQHQEKCVLLTCKRGANKGRQFYKCHKKKGQCPFFRWADEPLVVHSDDEEGEERERVQVPAVMELDDEDVDGSIENALQYLGHSAFRDGQLEAVKKLLDNQSVLALLPTGAGKSLIYQLYAALTPGVTIVITPLLSLMLQQQSTILPTACLRSSQPDTAAIENRVLTGDVKLLFITPERLFSKRFRRLLSLIHVPLIAIDEAHCLSQWSHNFRTAYLRIPVALLGGGHRAVFEPCPTLLALTATATNETEKSICDMLNIEEVVRGGGAREDLKLTLSRAGNDKMTSLVRVLKTGKFARILGIDSGDADQPARKRAKVNTDNVGWGSNAHAPKRVRARKSQNTGSIIIYVSKQRDCQMLMNYLKSSSLPVSVSMYHAGLPPAVRTKTQASFEKGNISILIATVAFGMGLDCKCVKGVVHFDLPSSLEAYSQEVGRVRGVGLGHVMFCEQDAGRVVSRCYRDGVDGGQVKRFLKALRATRFRKRDLRKQVMRVAAGGEDFESDEEDDGDSVSVMMVPEGDLCQTVGMKAETGETILAILERNNDGITVLPRYNTKLLIKFFSQTAPQLLKRDSLLPSDRLTLQTIIDYSTEKKGVHHLDLRKACVTENQLIGSLRRLGGDISYEGAEGGVGIEVRGDGDIDEDGVWDELREIERVKVRKAREMVAVCRKVDGLLTDEEQNEALHRNVDSYFAGETVEIEERETVKEEDMKAVLLRLCKEEGYGKRPRTAREMARILHGLDYVGFRAKSWSRYKDWGRYSSHDFDKTLQQARKIIHLLTISAVSSTDPRSRGSSHRLPDNHH